MCVLPFHPWFTHAHTFGAGSIAPAASLYSGALLNILSTDTKAKPSPAARRLRPNIFGKLRRMASFGAERAGGLAVGGRVEGRGNSSSQSTERECRAPPSTNNAATVADPACKTSTTRVDRRCFSKAYSMEVEIPSVASVQAVNGLCRKLPVMEALQIVLQF